MFGPTLFPRPAEADPSPPAPYLLELLERAEQARLWEERPWLLLGHYRPALRGGYLSQADDPGFFLAPDGKTDPRAELRATLRHFFSKEPVGRARQPAQCGFVARYEWLKERLAFDPQRLPVEPCPAFEAWLGELSPQGVTLIFPSAFMNNPASMFGHTLLRIDQQGQVEQTRLLAYSINFAAEVDTDNPIAFALLGVVGGFKGYFSTMPYYLKVREYGDIENRDIWEYRLGLTAPQLRRLIAHVWEMGNAYFDYFYFKENCAYHVLSMIEVANPDWHLTDRFLFWTVPADTIRALVEQPGLVREVVYRPSRSSLARARFTGLSMAERTWFGRILADPSQTAAPTFEALPLERRAAVLDAVSEYLQYKTVQDPASLDRYRTQHRALLIARSDLRVRSDPAPLRATAAPPEEGHRTSRGGVGIGWRGRDQQRGELFEEVTLRAGYHDLLDPDQGYTPDAQIELLGAKIRHYEESQQTRLEQVTVAHIVSLLPIDALFQAPSWKLNVGMRTLNRDGCRLCSSGVVNAGVGAAVEHRVVGRTVLFAFGELEADYSGAYAGSHRAGGGGTLGLLAELTPRSKLLVAATYLRFPIGDTSDEVRLALGYRYTLRRNLAVRTEFQRWERDNQAFVTLHAYF